MDEQLTTFVDRALAAGIARERIRTTLLEAGWPRDDVREALALYAETEFPVPVPVPRPYVSARDAFVFLVLFLTLYIASISWGNLLFQFIHLALPDPSDSTWMVSRIDDALRWATAALLVAAPVYFVLARKAYRSTRENPEKRQSKVRKWLTYLTLFVAAAVLLTDLIVLVFHLLDGELTARFLLKAAVVAMIAGSVFGFYLWSLRQDDVAPEALPLKNPAVRACAGVLAALVAASVVTGLVVAGSPQSAREVAYDRQRLSHLQDLQSALQDHYHRRDALPAKLEELAAEPGLVDSPLRDPVSDDLYEYRLISGVGYELCATFDRADPRGRLEFSEDLFWAHAAGRHCFRLTAHDAD